MQRLKEAVLVAVCGTLAFYPLLEQFIAPVLGLSFALAAVVAGAGLLRRRLHVRYSFLLGVWAAMLIVYVTWFGVAVVRGNLPEYITQDSAGFLLYIGAMPVLYLLIEQNQLQRSFSRMIDRLSVVMTLRVATESSAMRRSSTGASCGRAW